MRVARAARLGSVGVGVYFGGVVAVGHGVFWVPFSRPFRTILIWPPSPPLLFWLALRCSPHLARASPTPVGAPRTFRQRTRNRIAHWCTVALGACRRIGRGARHFVALAPQRRPRLPSTSFATAPPHLLSVEGAPSLGWQSLGLRRIVVRSCGLWHWVRFAHSTSRGGHPPPRKLAPPPSYSSLWVVRFLFCRCLAPLLLAAPLPASRWTPHTPPTPPNLRGGSPRSARFTGSPTARKFSPRHCYAYGSACWWLVSPRRPIAYGSGCWWLASPRRRSAYGFACWWQKTVHATPPLRLWLRELVAENSSPRRLLRLWLRRLVAYTRGLRPRVAGSIAPLMFFTARGFRFF